MATKYDIKERRPRPTIETAPERSGGWLRRFQRRIKLAFGSDDALVVQNRTEIAWKLYHDYHLLGILDAGERRKFHVERQGTLNVRPATEDEQVDYLVIPLSRSLRRVLIYRRRMGKDVEVYEMRAA